MDDAVTEVKTRPGYERYVTNFYFIIYITINVKFINVKSVLVGHY